MTSKIPGFLPPLPKTNSDEKIEKLEKKSKAELLELIDRQEKILGNKKFVNTLPDKGDKVRKLLNKLKHELSLRNRLEQSCQLFSKLSLASSQIDTNMVANLEWKREKDESKEQEYLDSDDDEDPIAIVAQHTAVKKIVVEKIPELITNKDLAEIKTFNKDGDENFDEHCEYIMEKMDKKDKYVENFKPYKTTVSNCHDPSKEKSRKRGKHWEVTAATQPPSVFGSTKEIPLKESLLLLEEQNRHLKEVQTKYAAEKLAQQLGKNIEDISHLASVTNYRHVAEVNSDDSDNESERNYEGSDNEVLDDEPPDGGVVFTVMN